MLVAKCHLALDVWELPLRDIQAAFDGAYIVNKKNAGMFSHLLELFREDEMNKRLGFFFRLLMNNIQSLSPMRYKMLS